MEVSELVHSVDIVEYIGQFVELERRGDEWWGLSCFKTEKTPSFSVRRDPPFFYDYSSGCGGNIITFIKLFFNCSGREAVEKLKQYAGVGEELTQSSGRLLATTICKRFSKPSKHEKLEKPTILSDNHMDMYEDRSEKLDIWRSEGISDASMRRFQVKYDPFSDRIVYPIRDMSGKIVNVGGRTLDPHWKERGLRKYTYFYSWGTMKLLYGLFENLDNVRERGEVIVFEGAKSVLIADSWGITNTAALLTSHLNESQMKLLASLGRTVVFALDKDVCIAQDKRIRTLSRYTDVRYICDTENLLDDKDSPVDKGKDVFLALYNNRTRLV